MQSLVLQNVSNDSPSDHESHPRRCFIGFRTSRSQWWREPLYSRSLILIFQVLWLTVLPCIWKVAVHLGYGTVTVHSGFEARRGLPQLWWVLWTHETCCDVCRTCYCLGQSHVLLLLSGFWKSSRYLTAIWGYSREWRLLTGDERNFMRVKLESGYYYAELFVENICRHSVGLIDGRQS
jgi:hypothetical protein